MTMITAMDVLPQVQERILAAKVPILGLESDEAGRSRFRAAVAQAMVELGLDCRADGDLPHIAAKRAAMMTGVGVIQPLLGKDGVKEVARMKGLDVMGRYRLESLCDAEGSREMLVDALCTEVRA